MHVIQARNVNDAYRAGMRLVSNEGILLPSRNGPVRRVSDPVCTKYMFPVERVLFDAKRDANPFFHLFEALWMLNGGRDVETMNHILKSFSQFSDDGQYYHGAYGWRWRHWPKATPSYTREIDQIASVIRILRDNCDDRRAVISMWDPVRDLGVDSKDIPCNDMIKVLIVNGKLDIQVFNRSNDIVFGCYGANAVHMSVLQEYLAAMIGVPIGRYFQISGDFHAYMESPYTWETYWPLNRDEPGFYSNEYEASTDNSVRNVMVHPLVTNAFAFDSELQRFMIAIKETKSVMSLNPKLFDNLFFRNVAIPMHWAFEQHMQKDDYSAILSLRKQRSWAQHDIDWLLAGEQWLLRRVEKRASTGVLWADDDAILKSSLRQQE